MLSRGIFLARRSMSTSSPTIGLIPGDGIGREVVPACRSVLDAVKAPFNYVELEAGFELFEKTGTALPEATVQSLKNDCQGSIFGAVSSPSSRVEGYSSPIVGMRKLLDLYANVRPVVNLKAFEEARKRFAERGQAKVTIVHKSNVLSVTDGVFREACLEISQQEQYKGIVVQEQLVDSMVYRMFREPEYFDVVVAPNMFGDIISDGAAALVGSLGLVPSCNLSDVHCMAEPVHGSAPDIAGQNIANPIACIRSSAMMLRYFGHIDKAEAVSNAVEGVLADGNLTPDLGGTATTDEIVRRIIERL